jgi:2-(1,2-epoxy-1,2-dihydrophenyl)acetyl-CoA isomerase
MSEIMSQNKGIDLSISNSIGTIRLNRPEVFHSFNTEMAKALQDALDECDKNEEVRAVLLTAEGKAFCAGQDLKETVGENGKSVPEIVENNYNPIVLKMKELGKPIVAGVNGVAAGAGANIALACDIVVAKESATFIQAFSKIGLIPDSGGTYYLPRLVGLQRAAALMMTGDKVTAKEAMEMGMIYKAYPDADFEAEVAKLMRKLAAMPTKALQYTKQLLSLSFSANLQEQLAHEADYQEQAANTEDFKEGVAAFIEKRNPIFKGR